MKKEAQNINGQKEVSSFPGIETNYRKGEDEVWAEISLRIDKQPERLQRKTIPLNFRLAVAATLLLLIGLTGFMRFFTKTIECPAGQHLSVLLPDGSTTELNALSTISYHPYWWRFAREVKFGGEGFFEVEKGQRFSVISDRGTTTVLGTSFNIFSRENRYEVTCFTGKVSVSSAAGNEKLVLHPNQQASLAENGKLDFVSQSDIQAVKSWTGNMFTFTSAPLSLVLEEIERQFNIRITIQDDFNFTYTGNFSKEYSGNEVLDLVCTPLGLKFEQKPNGEYLVYQE